MSKVFICTEMMHRGMLRAMKYEKTNVVLSLDLARSKRDLKAREDKTRKGLYSADITDDGKVLQLHWDLGEMTELSIQDLLDVYLDKMGNK